MSALLVSLCNVQKPSVPALLVVDAALTKVAQVPESTLFGVGATGLALNDQFIFAVTQVSIGDHRARSGLITFDRTTLKVVNRYQFIRGMDIHSLHLEGETLYAVSTGTDEVLSLTIYGGSVREEKVHWRPSDWAKPTDARHMNAICSRKGKIVVSGFGAGLKHGYTWQSEPKGFIQEISGGATISEGLIHPHSLLSVDDSLLFCESGRNLVRCLCGTMSDGFQGFTRGLCQLEDMLFVGTSAKRSPPETAHDPAVHGRCTISRLDPPTLVVDRAVDLSEHALEIYDIMPLPGPIDWAMLSPAVALAHI